MKHTIIAGDTLEKIKEIGNDTVHLTVTCYDDKTEILTKDGFKFFKDISDKEIVATLNLDKNKLEYQTIQEKQISNYSGDMHKIKSQLIDLLVTPNHNILTTKPTKNNFSLIPAERVFKQKQWKFKKDCIWEGKEKKMFVLPEHKFTRHPKKNKIETTLPKIEICMDDWLTFLGYYISEGCTYKNKTQNAVYLHQAADSQEFKNMESVIKRMGFNYCKQIRTRIGYTKKIGSLKISSVQLFNYVKKLGKSYDKYIPKEFLELHSRQLKYLYTSLMEGDGSNNRIYITSSKKLADQFCELLLKIGKAGKLIIRQPKDVSIRGRLIKDKNCRVNYMVSINHKKLNPSVGCSTKNHFFMEYYTGKVYCCSVPNKVIYVRRNGHCVWCGNSPPYYNAKDYNKEDNNVGNNESYKDYLIKINGLIKDIYDITVDGGIVVWNTSPVLDKGGRFMIPQDSHTLFVDNGFICRDDITWKKPDGAGKLRCGGWIQNKGKPLTWHPNIVDEKVMVYMKPGKRPVGDFNDFKNYYPKIPKDLLTNIWMINPETQTRWHDAPYPDELVRRCILLYSFKGDIVFDPFLGSGTTMKVARELERNSIGIELSPEYIEKAKQKIGFYQKDLFGNTVYEVK